MAIPSYYEQLNCSVQQFQDQYRNETARHAEFFATNAHKLADMNDMLSNMNKMICTENTAEREQKAVCLPNSFDRAGHTKRREF